MQCHTQHTLKHRETIITRSPSFPPIQFAIFGGALSTWLRDPFKMVKVVAEIHWHLACPNQFGDSVAHVSRKVTDDLYTPLAARGCRGIADHRRRGESWGGTGDVTQELEC